MFIHERAKVELKRKGWSYRSAAAAIGKSYQWVWLVLNGQATSRPVCDAILALPPSPVPYKRSGFAATAAQHPTLNQ